MIGSCGARGPRAQRSLRVAQASAGGGRAGPRGGAVGPGCRSAGSAEAQGRGRRRPQLEAASKPAKPQAAGVRAAAKMACEVSRRPAWPPWAFCAAFSRPFPHRGGQQLPGLPGGAQRGRRHHHPPPPLWSASLQTGRAPSSGSWGLREVLLAPGARRFAAPAVIRSAPVVLGLSSCLWWQARGGGGRGQEATEPGCVPRAARLAGGFSKCLSSLVPPAACTWSWLSFPPQGRTRQVVQAVQRWRKNTFQVQQVAVLHSLSGPCLEITDFCLVLRSLCRSFQVKKPRHVAEEPRGVLWTRRGICLASGGSGLLAEVPEDGAAAALTWWKCPADFHSCWD
ncbi:hypothetical protein AB1E19_019379 [Capra hircus]